MYFSTSLILLLIVLDILIYYLQNPHDEEDNGVQKNPSSIKESSSSPPSSSLSSSLYNQCRAFSLAEIKLSTNDFDDALIIGKGGFGKVYKGKLNLGEETDVAIKRSNLDSGQGATEFRAEIEMLSKLRHSHIVSLLGYCEDQMILVYEYMPNGSLDDCLHKKRDNSSPLTWIQRLNICIGAARGLDYLHTGTGVQYRVIHRDVKSSNILLDENLAGKIADFGISRITPAPQNGSTTNVYTGQIISTFGYMDAEYFSTHRLTRKSDVYAFGVVLLEVLCGRPALDFALDEQQHSLAGWAKHCIKKGNISRIVDPCLRGQVSTKCLKKFGEIAYECVRSYSKERPTMTMVLAKLELVLKLTLQSVGSRKDIGWSMFFTKALRHVAAEKKKGDSGVPQQQKQQPVGEMLKEFTFAELKTATSNFRLDTFLGEGGFGRVYKGWLEKSGDRFAVAVKILHNLSMQGHKEWQTEVNILGKFRHPNLVKLLGYCQQNEKLLLVYEYMKKGSLDKHLFKRHGLGDALPWSTRIKIAIGAAQGLAYLHAPENNVIYRDLKASNILLDEDFSAKLSDFGLAKLGPEIRQSHVSTSIVGTYGYAAPEYVMTGHLYVKSDVYCFGVVMLEIITGLRVIDKNRPGLQQDLVEWAKPLLISGKRRLHRVMDPRLEQNYPSKAAHKAAELILNCLQQEPTNRPSMEEVVSGLHAINAIKMNPSKSKATTIKNEPT